jgi:hypothetical protein
MIEVIDLETSGSGRHFTYAGRISAKPLPMAVHYDDGRI